MMIAAEISIWATEPIWSSVWKRWQIKHCQSAFHSGGSHLQTLHGEYGGSAELQSHCDAQLQKTTWQDIFLAAQNGWVAASRHDAILKWPLLNFQMESQEKQIPHLSPCPSLPKPCGARLGNRQLHKGCFKTLSVWSNHYQIIIKPPSMIVRTGKMWARSATESLPTIGVNPILPAAERKTFTQTSQNR